MVIWWLGVAMAASLQGTVRSDPEGEPLQGTYVLAWDLRGSYVYTSTDADGAFTLSDLPAGGYRVQAITTDSSTRVPRYFPNARSYCDAALLTLTDEDVFTGVDLSLPTGGTLTGRLIGPDGEPVVGAELTAEGQDELDGLEREATTGSDGTFSLTGLDALDALGGSWLCTVSAEGWPDQALGPSYSDDGGTLFEVELGLSSELGDLPLLAGIQVEGVVEGPDGPQADANVHVYASSQVVSVQTEDDGTYAASGLPPGEVLAWTSGDSIATTYFPDADRPTDYLLTEDEGEVLRGVDLFPPAEATFRATLIPAEEIDLSGVTGLLYNDTKTVGFGARADADGALAIDGLHGGDYTLYLFASDEGYADDFVRDEDGEPRVFTVEGETDNAHVDITLIPKGSVSGMLIDDLGEPVRGGFVLATNTADAEAGPEVGAADEEGLFAISGMDGGRWRLEAKYSPLCDADPDWVSVWYPDDVVYEDYAGALSLADGERVTDLVFTLPRDLDADGMGDAWEEEQGLDPDRDDSAEDPDGDGYTNLEEYLLGTDPTVDDIGGDGLLSEGCGCGGGKRGSLLLVLGLGLTLRRRRSCVAAS